MTTTYTIVLRINDFRSFQTALSHTHYYLAAYAHENLVQITPSHNLLYDDSPFLIAADDPIDRIEVWNYDRHKKIGSLFIKQLSPHHNYSHIFKNANLALEMTA